MAGNDRFIGRAGCIEARFPARVSHIYDNPDAVHLSDHVMPEITEPTICGLRTAVAYYVATVVGKVHHAYSELEKRLDEIQLEVLDELTPEGTFAIEEVLAYFEKYTLNARWHSCTREIGTAALEQRVSEIEAAMDLTF